MFSLTEICIDIIMSPHTHTHKKQMNKQTTKKTNPHVANLLLFSLDLLFLIAFLSRRLLIVADFVALMSQFNSESGGWSRVTMCQNTEQLDSGKHRYPTCQRSCIQSPCTLHQHILNSGVVCRELS